MACPVCFGAVEPSVRESLNVGILVLLGVTVGVLAAFARFFVHLARRARMANAEAVAAGFSRPTVPLKADATS
jgi:predicted transporter